MFTLWRLSPRGPRRVRGGSGLNFSEVEKRVCRLRREKLVLRFDGDPAPDLIAFKMKFERSEVGDGETYCLM